MTSLMGPQKVMRSSVFSWQQREMGIGPRTPSSHCGLRQAVDVWSFPGHLFLRRVVILRVPYSKVKLYSGKQPWRAR